MTSRVHNSSCGRVAPFYTASETPEGREMWGKWVYREIVAPERLVFVSSFTDEKGKPDSPSV